ncbi:AAA family ATPase [Clostridium tyrobutyricum]|uniref:AAA family ATPase n=1 Tax=Clostridium tyrobutyricum TaxID=1519 RepID=UPI001C384E5E|nr:AAA family ATPase [Clostridium tyrobutyricum]MBV4424325.1 AAA family ATPase [Clostridium tyrobutyricum]
MRDFYIKKLSLTGPDVKISSVDFIDGLNIICGPSDTGKSYIAECFDFMFGGSSKDFPIDKKTGYNHVRMQIATYNGDITLERNFEESSIYVSSLNPNFESGKYSTGKAKKNMNDFWLRLMGIDEPVSIIKNENFERNNLTVRSFLHSFCIKEDNVFQKESIMFQRSVYSRTAIMNILLYFITGNTYNEEDPKETKAIKAAKKKAIKEYIDSNLSYLAVRKAELAEYNTPNIEELQLKINDILNEITETEGSITIAVNRSKKLSNEILELNDQLAECSMMLNRFQVLRSQYKSDIKRLTFIVEGDLHKSNIPEIVKCPFCNGSLPKAEEKSCAEAAYAELQKILPQLSDLDDAESDIAFEQDELEEKSNSLIKERTEIETVINSELRPRIATLRKTLAEYRHSIEIHSQSAAVESFEKVITEDLYKIDIDEEELEVKFRPKEHYTMEIRKRLDDILADVLEKCNFTNYSNSYFDLDSFDVVVNGKSKRNFGKGYRAFLNTAVAFTFMKYLSSECEYAPTLLLIDSPILSLKEGKTNRSKNEKDEKISEGMKSSLFQYLVNNQQYGQTIVIENEIPNVDYKNTNIIRFTHNEHEGRYGLLYGVTD